MKLPVSTSLRLCCLVMLGLGLLINSATAKPRIVPSAAKPGNATPAIDFSELDRLVPEELKEKNTPGAVIAVVSGDQVVYQKAFGVANGETNAPMQPEMLFRLGSTTKMFTAAALVSLAEKDKIKLSDPIGTRVKGLHPKIAAVTPHHLLSNSAGLRDFAAPVVSNDDASLGKMLRAWKDDVFFAEQGEIYSYSSAGFWLSGLVIEDVHGKPYADAIDELIFKPVGMERTTLRPFLAITYPFATGHALDTGKPAIVRPMFNNTAMWPAGSIFSNAKDLSRWVVALLNEGRVEGKQLLSPSLIKNLFGHHVRVPGETDAYYGYGLTIYKFKDLEFVAHGGFSRGYGSMIQMVPARKFAVIVLTNKSGETMRKTLNKATEIGLGLKDDAQQPQTAAVAPLTNTEMSDYVGTYSHAPQTWEVFVKDGKLFMKLDGNEHPMTKTGDRKFTFGDRNENEVVFVTGKSGKIDLIFTGLYGARRVTAGK